MGIGDRMKGLATDVQEGVKTSSLSLLNLLLRLISGFFLGLTLALVFQELAGFGTLMLVFLNVLILGLFVRVSASWSIFQILIFDLFCVLVAQLLRMYILLAP